MKTLYKTPFQITVLKQSANERWLALAGQGSCNVVIQDRINDRLEQFEATEATNAGKAIEAHDFSPNSQFLAVGDNGGAIVLWLTGTWSPYLRLAPTEFEVYSF